MRIIAGRFRGKKLVSPEGRSARPTSDRAREAVFNLLAHRYADKLRDAQAADVFAGTGALGLEALSRGAAHVTFIENNPGPLKALRTNVRGLRVEGETRIVNWDALTPPPPKAPCGLLFLDPPYGEGLVEPVLAALVKGGWLAEEALCVIETEAKETFSLPNGFESLDERKYGKAKVSFLLWRQNGK